MTLFELLITGYKKISFFYRVEKYTKLVSIISFAFPIYKFFSF